MNDVVVFYEGEQVSVPKEVADFLEQDRKRAQAQDRQDRRHLSKSEFETVLSCHISAQRELEDTVHRNLQLENLQEAVAGLDDEERELISLRYDEELSMEEIGKLLGVSKMAVSKRLKKLHEKLRSSVN
jgi:RNA polymerase sigma factor (sigma-70 family)